ncbi:hypothetical protein GSY74_03865 [Sulfurovum sp. bin170]|uniref:hypothetical protein n=1 Tax=Sulfurovum sp. bin170 TaxID=2695268 RepID=UPI0013DEE086|nr:hypothetical protein [Sulfurovum sp. bin170]NEW60409.1 hypothetical protein [Sulfurovum sp. bin170]
MQLDITQNQEEFNSEDAKAEINRLLRVYRVKKDDLEWADDDWEVSEIQEELDGYAREIKILKSQVRKHEQSVGV